jgi:M6 family metalloprotease-like protein
MLIVSTSYYANITISDEDNYSSTSADFLFLDEIENDDNYVSSLNTSASNASAVSDELNLANIVIFIYFQDESMPDISSATMDKFVGADNSLYDYYYDISFGKILIQTYYATTVEEESTAFYAYQSQYDRDHYKSILDGSSLRCSYEKELLDDAIDGFNDAMDFTDIDVDQDGDGYVDNISFVISNSYVSSNYYWGSLLWPHAWRMSILEENTTDTGDTCINDKKVEYYTFNFLDNLTTGLVCHEFSHILGSPDLYHYYSDTSYYQVGYWDLMHFECDTPQYLTTYMRYNYLGARSTTLSSLYTEKISQITASGTFTLKPTTMVTDEDSDFLAYKIVIDEYESIWIEYRNNEVSTYDSDLTGSGLIIYRVNTTATLGNQNGRYEDSDYPDEVYVYRPDYSTESNIASCEKENLQYAYLSEDNSKFDLLGESNSSSKYDEDCIFLTDGENTGIVITPLTQTNGEISFEVSMPASLSSANQVEEVEVLDKYKYEELGEKDSNIEISYGSDLETTLSDAVTVLITYQDGSSIIATQDNCNFIFDSDKISESQQAIVRYNDSYNTNVEGYFNLIIADGVFNASIRAYPAIRSYSIGEDLDLTGLILTLTYSSGTTDIVAFVDEKLSFTYIGYDSSTSGEYQVEVTYSDELGNQDTVIVSVSVIAEITSIEVNIRKSQQLISFSPTGIDSIDYDTIYNALPDYLEVTGIQSDGTSCILGSTAYEIVAFTWNGCTTYTINVMLLTDVSIVSPDYNITIMDENTISSVVLQINPKLTYKYGECLDLSDGILIVYGDNTSTSISLEGFYDKFAENYDCTLSGSQSISADIYNETITLNVTVGNDASELLSSNNDNIYINLYNTYYIQAQKATTLEDFIGQFASTFNIKIYYNDIYINVNAYSDMLISDKLVIHLYNDDDVMVAEIKVYVLGDTNSDGILDIEDADNLASGILSGKTKNDNYDINKDGIYNIVDFVLLMEITRE